MRHSRQDLPVAALAAIALVVCAVGCGDPSPKTRSVGGSRTVTFWSDSGKSSPQPSGDIRPPAAIRAWTPDGKTSVTGLIDSGGGFHLDGVAEGAYVFELATSAGRRHFFRTEAAQLDLGFDDLGRSDLRVPTQATPVTFDVTGLAPADPQDLVEMTSSNASLWERLAPQGTLSSGSTSASLSFDWHARPTPLLRGSEGDVLFVHQLSTQQDAASGLSYQTAQSWGQLPSDAAVTDGAAETLSVALAPVTSTGRLDVRWRTSTFEVLSQWPPNTQITGHSLFIEGIAWQLDLGPNPWNGFPDLLSVPAPPGTADVSLSLGYGRFLPSLWKERLQAYVTARFRYPYLGGTIFYSGRMSVQASMDAPPSELTPTIFPPQGVRIGNVDTLQVRTGVGTGPLFSWAAPSLGTPDHYVVDVEELVVSGTTVTFTPLATFDTTETRAQFPDGTLTAGRQYVAWVTAAREPTGHYATAPAPYRRHFPQDVAQVATAPFSP